MINVVIYRMQKIWHLISACVSLTKMTMIKTKDNGDNNITINTCSNKQYLPNIENRSENDDIPLGDVNAIQSQLHELSNICYDWFLDLSQLRIKEH